jgi:hypothetical protein
MKKYPKIPGPAGGHHKQCYAFVKYDGSNIRFEWSKKRGWYKFNTRKTMIDQNTPIFGSAIPLFLQKYGDDLEKIFKSEKLFFGVQSVVVFAEWFGELSFSGKHVPWDKKYDIVLFDVNPHKKGFLGPKQFLDTFGHLKVAELIYTGNFGDWLVESVRKETIDIKSKYDIQVDFPEGVICKGAEANPHKQWSCKIKTDRYKEALKVLYESDWEKYWEN